MLQPASFAQHDTRANNAIRTNDRFCAQLCFWINDCGLVNLRVAHFKRCGRDVNVLPSPDTDAFPSLRGEGEGAGPWKFINLEPSSFIQEREHEIAFGHDGVVHYATA